MYLYSVCRRTHTKCATAHLTDAYNSSENYRITNIILFLSCQEKFVELLIRNGADVNAKNEDKDTPLHYAAEKGSILIFNEKITE